MGRKSRAKRDRPAAIVLRPRWYHSVIAGAAILFVMMFVRVLIGIPRLVQHPEEVPNAFVLLAIATSAGGLAGLSYAVVGTRLRRVGRIGRYLAGIATVASYLAAAFLAIWFIDRSVINYFAKDVAASVFAFVVSIAIFGLLFARHFLGPENPDEEREVLRRYAERRK